MVDVEVVEGVEAFEHLDECGPDFGLFDVFPGFFVFADGLEKVASVCVFHDDAEAGRLLFPEGFFVEDNVLVSDGGEDADFVESVFFFLFVEVEEFDAFEGVDFAVREAFDLVY